MYATLEGVVLKAENRLVFHHSQKVSMWNQSQRDRDFDVDLFGRCFQMFDQQVADCQLEVSAESIARATTVGLADVHGQPHVDLFRACSEVFRMV